MPRIRRMAGVFQVTQLHWAPEMGHGSMKTLQLELRMGGFTFRRVLREGPVAVYRQSKPGTTIEAYEVILIRRRGERVIAGRTLEASERYPRSEERGKRGWTYQTKERAMAKFNALCERAKAA